MDCAVPIAIDNGDRAWSDIHSLASSEEGVSILIHPSSIWTNSISTNRLSAGQLSPISTELNMSLSEGPPTASTMPTTIHSASSSCTDVCSTSYSENTEGEDAGHDILWEQGSDDVLTVPKLEPVEDEEFHMEDLKEAPTVSESDSNATACVLTKTKRPRGRPRKHPLTPRVTMNKIAKGRSKTG